jgi:hypothetical protein
MAEVCPLKGHPHTTNCRVTRHLISTISQKHVQPAETRPANIICAQEAFQAKNDHKLYSKVLTIRPNNQHKNSVIIFIEKTIVYKSSPSCEHYLLNHHTIGKP